jgi:hypothetical protein
MTSYHGTTYLPTIKGLGLDLGIGLNPPSGAGIGAVSAALIMPTSGCEGGGEDFDRLGRPAYRNHWS